MKRRTWYFFGLLALVLVACGPAATVETNVLPTLISVTVPQQTGDAMVLQGRYFGDGHDGLHDGSYVILGANISGGGGVRVDPSTWSANRIELDVPEGAGAGYVYVVVAGVRSNGVPADLP